MPLAQAVVSPYVDPPNTPRAGTCMLISSESKINPTVPQGRGDLAPLRSSMTRSQSVCRALYRMEPEQLHGPAEPAFARMGQQFTSRGSEGFSSSQEALMEQNLVYAGIDVSKTQLDAAVRPTDDVWRLTNDHAGIEEVVSRLKASGQLWWYWKLRAAMNSRLRLLWPSRMCQPQSSIRVRSDISPGPRGSLPRPIYWMRRSLLVSLRSSSLPSAPCRTSRGNTSVLWLPEGARSIPDPLAG